jgi:hypothetical protein
MTPYKSFNFNISDKKKEMLFEPLPDLNQTVRSAKMQFSGRSV